MVSTINKKIIERLEEKKISIAELERRAGLSIHSVRNLLKGRIKSPRAHTLQAIAEVLDFPLVDLMDPSPHEEIGSVIRTKSQKEAFLEYPDLMLDCSSAVLNLCQESGYILAVDDYLEILKETYQYALRGESKIVDFRFIRWLIEDSLRFSYLNLYLK